jgi:hypothetical protein
MPIKTGHLVIAIVILSLLVAGGPWLVVAVCLILLGILWPWVPFAIAWLVAGIFGGEGLKLSGLFKLCMPVPPRDRCRFPGQEPPRPRGRGRSEAQGYFPWNDEIPPEL